jgi:hypothetical protein
LPIFDCGGHIQLNPRILSKRAQALCNR